MLLEDRGYDADWIREFARQNGAWANIPPKRNRKDPICFSPYLYRVRNLVERFFNKIKQCRRVATRYDKLAANYLAFVKLASIRIWLRANESTAWCDWSTVLRRLVTIIVAGGYGPGSEAGTTGWENPATAQNLNNSSILSGLMVGGACASPGL
jgi:transposase